MRVLHVVNDLSAGGAERLVLDLATRTPGESADIATVHTGGVLAGRFADAGVTVLDAGRIRGGPGSAALLRLAWWARRYDIVHTHLWSADVWGVHAARLAGRPVVAHAHNAEPDLSGWKRALQAGAWTSADRVICISGAVAAWVSREAPAARIRVIYNGIDVARFAAPWRGGGPVVAIGRLVPQKGFEHLIEAARRLPHLQFAIAGEGPLRANLERSAPSNVRFLGLIDDVPGLLQGASCAAMPSRWEGFGLAALEAMAAGVPLVCTAVEGLPELVGDAARLVPPGDAAALASAIAAIVADPGDLSSAGRARAAEFDASRMRERVADLHDEVVTSRG